MSTVEPMDFTNTAVSFTIGTDKKMNMALDDIIKKNQVGKKKEQRKLGKKAAVQNNQSRSQRNKNLVNSVSKKSTALRQNRIDQARGLKIIRPRINLRPASTNASFNREKSTRSNKIISGNVAWAQQQRQRRLNQSRKVALASQRATNFTSRQISTRSTGLARERLNPRNRLLRTRASTTKAAQPRTSSNIRTANTTRQDSTLNERFSRPTRGIAKRSSIVQRGGRSFVTQNSPNRVNRGVNRGGNSRGRGGNARGRGGNSNSNNSGRQQFSVSFNGRGGNNRGRGGNRGGRGGNRGGRGLSFRVNL